MRSARIVALAGAVLAAAPGAAQTVLLNPATLDFESLALGTTTPIDVEFAGLTATLWSPGGNVFSVVDEFQESSVGFEALTGNVLLDTDQALHALILDFLPAPAIPGRVPDFVSLNFALRATTGSLTLRHYARIPGEADRLVDSVTIHGVVPDGYFYAEGSIASASYEWFDYAVITSTAPDFAIDDLRVEQAEVYLTPEPATAALTGAGLIAAALAAGSRRRVRMSLTREAAR